MEWRTGRRTASDVSVVRLGIFCFAPSGLRKYLFWIFTWGYAVRFTPGCYIAGRWPFHVPRWSFFRLLGTTTGYHLASLRDATHFCALPGNDTGVQKTGKRKTSTHF